VKKCQKTTAWGVIFLTHTADTSVSKSFNDKRTRYNG